MAVCSIRVKNIFATYSSLLLLQKNIQKKDNKFRTRLNFGMMMMNKIV